MSEINKALIKKYLAGQCIPEELRLVREHLKTPKAQQIFDEVWDEEWKDEIHSDYHKASLAQKQRWKALLDQKIYEEEISTKAAIRPFYQRPLFWRYAAVWFVLMMGVGVWRWNQRQAAPEVALAFEEKVNPKGQRTQIMLPDSSMVYLGALSKLRFEKNFSGPTREVALEGEAFFDVKKNPKRPFIIHTRDISTQVLGTSFKIDAFAHQPIKVLVSTGKVRVDRKVNHQLRPLALLLPGETVTWDEWKVQKSVGRIAIEDITGWTRGRLHFEATQLQEIASILERWYNVEIKIEKEMLARKLIKVNLTTNISIEKVMKILSMAGSFNYQINKQQITISPLTHERKHM